MEKEEAIRKAIKLVRPGMPEGELPSEAERKLLSELNSKLGEYMKQLEVDNVSLKTNSESWGILICFCLCASKEPETALRNALVYYSQRNALTKESDIMRNLAKELEKE